MHEHIFKIFTLKLYKSKHFKWRSERQWRESTLMHIKYSYILLKFPCFHITLFWNAYLHVMLEVLFIVECSALHSLLVKAAVRCWESSNKQYFSHTAVCADTHHTLRTVCYFTHSLPLNAKVFCKLVFCQKMQLCQSFGGDADTTSLPVLAMISCHRRKACLQVVFLVFIRVANEEIWWINKNQ